MRNLVLLPLLLAACSSAPPSTNTDDQPAIAPAKRAMVAGQVPGYFVTTASADVVYRHDLVIPSDVTQLRLRFANTTAYGEAGGSPVAINAAVCTSDGALGCSQPAVVHLGQTLPADGNDLVLPSPTGWDAVRPGADGRIVITYSVPAQSVVAAGNLNSWGCYSLNSTTVSPPPPCDSADTNPVYWIHVEFMTTKRRVFAIGDSLSVGSSTAGVVPGVSRAWPQLLAHARDFAVQAEGLNGDKLQDLAAMPTLTRWAQLKGADCIIALSTNDYMYGVEPTEQALLAGALELRGRGCSTVRTETVAPCAPYGAYEANRLALNALARSMVQSHPFEVDGVLDFDAAMDPLGTGALQADADAGDMCHWSVVGQQRAETIVSAAL
jgi:lysophospholipase L1-like esterase